MKKILDFLNHNVFFGLLGSDDAGVGGAWYCTICDVSKTSDGTTNRDVDFDMSIENANTGKTGRTEQRSGL